MSNSKLITCTVKSPNHSGQRTHAIDKIVIHHMAGRMTAAQCGGVFQPSSRQASSNYGIGYDGSIGLYVDECNRAWTTGWNDIDQRAVTIEISNSAYGEPWAISEASMTALIKLVADICKRNGIKKCTYTGGAKGNNYPSNTKIIRDGTLQMHKWYDCTGCPGTTLQTKFQYICDEANKLIGDTSSVTMKKDSYINKESYNGSGHVAKIPEKAKVNHITDDGWGWSQISYNSQVGWTYNSNLKGISLSNFKKATALKSLAIRESAKTSAKVICKIPKKKTFTVKSINPKNWAYVSYNGSTGWCKYSTSRMEVK